MTNATLTQYGKLIVATQIDLADAFSNRHLWTELGWQDILARFRRSWAGPIWLLLSAVIFVGALGVVYSTIFNMSIRTYIPVVAVGLAVWNFISATTSEAVLVFVESEMYIRQRRMNLFIFVLRVIWRNILIFFNQLFVSIVVIVVFGAFTIKTFPLALLGIFLLFIQALWVVPLLGVLGTRFRDLQPMIQNVLLVCFLVTPVLWLPELLGSRRFISDFNPLSHFIGIIREPLLGTVPSATSYAVVAVVFVIGFTLAGIIYGRFRNRVVYWL